MSDDFLAAFVLLPAGTRVLEVCDECGCEDEVYTAKPATPYAQRAGFVPLVCRACGCEDLALDHDAVKALRLGFREGIVAEGPPEPDGDVLEPWEVEAYERKRGR